MKEVVLVVDMQRDFLEPGGALYCGDEVRRIIPPMAEFLERKASEGATLIFTQDWHDPDDPEFQIWPPHCVADTPGAEVIPELAKFVSVSVRKKRYTAFWETDLEKILYDLDPDVVHVVGVCTDICVLHTVADLKLRLWDRKIIVHKDLVASFDPEAHRWALKHMENILKVEVQ